MTTYSYDRENRLISQNVDGNVTSFAYDGFGRKRRESRGVNPDVILNWDGDQMIVESSDLDPEAPSKAYYVADGVIYAENANLGSRKSRRDYAVDFLGSVTGLTDSDSGISSVRRWSAYGKLLSGSSEPIGYFWTGNTGSRVYQSLGLNDNRARHYGRNIKQWITRDPLWPSELPYAYVGGNPVTRIDPSGLTVGDCDFDNCFYPKVLSGRMSLFGACVKCSSLPYSQAETACRGYRGVKLTEKERKLLKNAFDFLQQIGCNPCSSASINEDCCVAIGGGSVGQLLTTISIGEDVCTIKASKCALDCEKVFKNTPYSFTDALNALSVCLKGTQVNPDYKDEIKLFLDIVHAVI
jgi:RHS repeat-associated protein